MACAPSFNFCGQRGCRAGPGRCWVLEQRDTRTDRKDPIMDSDVVAPVRPLTYLSVVYCV
jgi:hypothetical protein